MTVTVGESDDDAASPWAGEVPAPAQPVEFTWAKSGDSEGAWRGADTNDRVAGVSDGDIEAGDGQPALLASALSSERRRWAFGAIAAVILLALGWLVVGRESGDDSLDATDPSTPADTIGDAEVEDSLPTETEAEPERTIPGSASRDEADVPQWQEGTIALPPLLRASTTPFDLVALTGDGTFVEVAIPSGRVNSLELRRGAQGQVVAGATTTLLTRYATGQNAQLLRIGEPSTEVALPENIDGIEVVAESDRYIGIAYGNRPSPDRVEIGADGSVIISEATARDGNIWQQQFLADGSRLVTEAGGLYRGADGVFTRISTGVLIAASNDHALVRECDDTMQCTHLTIATSTGERTEVVLDDGEVSPFGFGATELSPDGQWLRYLGYNQNSVDEVLIKLATGDRTELTGSNGQQGSGVWAADSSGFFRQSPASGFEFYDVTTGESIRFGEDVGRIQSFDIRINAGAPAAADPIPTASGIELIGLTQAGDIVQIDVDSRAAVTTEGLPLSSDAPSTIFVDAQGATISSYDDVSSVRFDAAAGTVSTTPALEPSGPLFQGSDRTTVWQRAVSPPPDGLAFELVDSSGVLLGATIATDAADINDVLGPDGAGGIIVELDLGGVFVLDESDTPELLTTGELLAVNAQVAYVRECDGTLRCGVFVLDRVSGDRQPIDLSVFDRVGDIDSRGVPPGQNISPDGQVVFVRDSDRPNSTMMIDTVEDLWTSVGVVDLASPIVWTPDSGYAVWLSDGQVTVYERSTRSIRTVNTVELRAIAAVPNS